MLDSAKEVDSEVEEAGLEVEEVAEAAFQEVEEEEVSLEVEEEEVFLEVEEEGGFLGVEDVEVSMEEDKVIQIMWMMDMPLHQVCTAYLLWV